jgi:hypothetical protein
MVAGFAHLDGEKVYTLIQRSTFEILHHFVAILDRIDTLQTGVKERFQIVFVFAGSDGIYDLITIQVGEEFRRLERSISCAIFRAREKNAVED